ncbi:MAG: L,D-transpeptidase family protein [Croceibacterium sp.]
MAFPATDLRQRFRGRSYEQRNLGHAVSHGCVRLSVKNAATLWELVKREKMANTTVVLTGAIPARVTGGGALPTDATDRRCPTLRCAAATAALRRRWPAGGSANAELLTVMEGPPSRRRSRL